MTYKYKGMFFTITWKYYTSAAIVGFGIEVRDCHNRLIIRHAIRLFIGGERTRHFIIPNKKEMKIARNDLHKYVIKFIDFDKQAANRKFKILTVLAKLGLSKTKLYHNIYDK